MGISSLKKLTFFAALILAGASFSSQTTSAEHTSAAVEEIQWLSWDEAIARMATEPKKIFVDVYTDWCGWCKRMDATTFVDPAIVSLMDEHFYAVKLDAEQRETIEYDSHTFVYRSDVGRRGVHELAYSLLDGRMSYPSYIYLSEEQQRISISPGYKDAETMKIELTFIGADHYKSQSYEDFRIGQGN
ncbi:MAG: DUF255 domain-containing protein [Bacteroidota bacterium]